MCIFSDQNRLFVQWCWSQWFLSWRILVMQATEEKWKIRKDEKDHIILQLLKHLSPCFHCVLYFFFPNAVCLILLFTPLVLCCSARSSVRFLTWITLTAPFCWKLWQLYLALTWWTSLSITLCPTRRMLARYVSLRAEKHCEGQRVGTFRREQERNCWDCSPAVSAQASALSMQCTCAVPSAASTSVCVFFFLQSWAEDIMAIVQNPLTYNASRYTFLEKM